MSHAMSLKSAFHRNEASKPIPRNAKVIYVVMFALLLAAILAFVVIRGINGSVNNQPTTVQQNTNAANPGTTKETGAPATDTGTAKDRSTPDTSGSGGNTILNPESNSTF